MLRTLFLLLLLLIVATGGAGYWMYEYQLKAPLALVDKTFYVIPPKATLLDVSKDLIKKELLNYPTAVIWANLARWQGKADKIKAGEYAIPIGTTPLDLLEIFIHGKSIQHALTIIEGWNFRQMMATVNQNPHLSHTLIGLDDAAIMAKLGFPNQQPEGRFYPDTYHFPAGMSDVDFLRRAYLKMEHALTQVWDKRQPDLPLQSSDQALILASIIEKETGVAVERAEIAGVFIRRLQQDMPLQTDPTVIYALGETYDGNITKADLKVDSPYNTYVYKGLPPTPIAMPSQGALEASVNPASGKTLYFVAKGSGAHYFSATLNEHECAVIEYQLKGKSKNYQSRCQQYPNCEACRI